ncbi:CCGSCS motif protein [Marinobacter sp. 1-3A]|uniref:CCGSCS motif protein n=1 Tax=Marinobacter sp. 1-3A TaxID=2582920 RepID=UPI0019064F64|nr:CCGSCS motif protein [Marinobacter sp. 1-3A]MBK1872764.1 CCGSCS motif protein [Marinobacter sp. 1-3A]
MTQLFKEVTSSNEGAKANADQPTDGAVQQTANAAESTEKNTEKKGKHGDPGVCCGGCS